jgi:GNAT superfamily N-acetyltransferase
MEETLDILAVDPRSTGATMLLQALSQELAERYDLVDDGSGHFKPEDVLVPRSVFLLGSVSGRPVACGALRPMDLEAAEIKRMYVVPFYRGRGYSRLILSELERQAAAMDYLRVRLETGVRQPEAIGLYERAGYRRIPNFGRYAGNLSSLCFEKVFPSARNRGAGGGT